MFLLITLKFSILFISINLHKLIVVFPKDRSAACGPPIACIWSMRHFLDPKYAKLSLNVWFSWLGWGSPPTKVWEPRAYFNFNFSLEFLETGQLYISAFGGRQRMAQCSFHTHYWYRKLVEDFHVASECKTAVYFNWWLPVQFSQPGECDF